MPVEKPLKIGVTGLLTQFGDTDSLPIVLEIEPSVNQTSQGPVTSSKNAGATITIMDCVYLGSAGTWLLTDTDAAATAKGILAISLESKTSGQAMKVALHGSVIRNDSWAWATVGAPLYLSSTAGGITDTVPAQSTDRAVRVIGWVLTDNCIYFMPSADYITYT